MLLASRVDRPISLSVTEPSLKVPAAYAGSFNVRTSRIAYAATDNAVSTTTTFPLVLNLFWFNPLSPISEKNCWFPCCRRKSEIRRMPAPYTANSAPCPKLRSKRQALPQDTIRGYGISKRLSSSKKRISAFAKCLETR